MIVAVSLYILGFIDSVSGVIEQLCICLSWLRTANICMRRCIVRCASRLFEPTWTGRSAVPLSAFISFYLSFLFPLPFYSHRSCLEKIILPLHSLLEKRVSKGAQRGRGSEGNWLLLLFKSEACCLLGDNWHTRRVMCLDRKEESKKKRKKRVGKLKGTWPLCHNERMQWIS